MQLSAIEGFEFTGRDFDATTGILRLRWRLLAADESMLLEERFGFATPAGSIPPDHPSLDAALDLLHWIAGVSYWKVACRGRVHFADRRPDTDQADALERVYRHGLAEMAWRNGLDHRYWPDFRAGAGPPAPRASVAGLSPGALVPMGGGKDSLVALERVRDLGIGAETLQVGSAGLISRVARAAGTRHHVIARELAPELAGLNAAGALNGHVPITAINAAALVVAALLRGFDSIVFANERSADTPTLTAPDGRVVNHQFAKSLDFERLLGDWVARYVAADLEVFSLLRRDRELSVCAEFARLERYHDVFSSCNRNFHLDGARTARWCGDCPKCFFVYLALAPFLDPGRMRSIFGRDLLAEPESCDGFAALLELDAPRPFECVGEADEARAALVKLAADPRWRDHAVVRALAARLDTLRVPDWAGMVEPGGPHRIPERYQA